MAVRAEWDSTHPNCMLIELTDPLTWDAFHAGIRGAHDRIRRVSTRATIIVNTRAHLPKGQPMMHFRDAFQDQPDNVERVIIVSNNYDPFLLNFIKRVATILQRLYPFKSRLTFVNTLEQAYALVSAPYAGIGQKQ